MIEAQQAIRKAVLEPIQKLIPKVIRDFFARGDGITYITALGTVTPDYVSGLPKVQFDRDQAASGKTYCRLAAYTPSANDRVLLMKVGHDWVIVGKVINT